MPIKNQNPRKELKKSRAEVKKIAPKKIAVKPAKMQDSRPNFVNTRYQSPSNVSTDKSPWSRISEDEGTNPSNKNVPKIKYTPYGGEGYIYQGVNKKGKMEFKYPNTGKQIKGSPAPSFDKKRTKSAPKATMSKSAPKPKTSMAKNAPVKKTPLKSTKK
jgi:hypothetical protein